MRKRGENISPSVVPIVRPVENFLKGLELLSQTHTCSGCKLEQRERCEIVRCALEKGVENCGECKEFPCEILKNNPGVVRFHTIENLEAIKRIGFEKWVEEQIMPGGA